MKRILPLSLFFVVSTSAIFADEPPHVVVDRGLNHRQPTVPQPSRTEKTRVAVEGKNVPIAFWGKVVDQDDNPLPGAQVAMETREWYMPESLSVLWQLEPTFRTHRATTGPNGLFQLTDARGDIMTLKSLEKEGYKVSPKALRSFGYNISTNHVPDPNNPVLFKMWKQGTPEPLIVGDRFFGIVPDGRSYTLDLVKGTKHEGATAVGDLKVKVSRPLTVERNAKYPWEFTIEGIDGGVLITQDELMIQAPASGYSPRYEARFSPADESWRDGVAIQLYAKSRGGKIFARLKAEVLANYNGKSVFNIEYALNPAGSRNLEPGGPRISPGAQ